MYKIVVIETEPSSFEGLFQLIKKSGLDVEKVAIGSDAVVKTSEIKPDLVIMDPRDSEHSSLQVCKSIKNNPYTLGTPVIFISKHADFENNATLSKCFESGGNDFIHANVSDEETIVRIKAGIRVKQELTKSKALNDQLNKMNAELYERNLAVEKELYTTRQLQQSLLPAFIKEDEDGDSTDVEGKTAEHTEVMNFGKCHFKDDTLRVTGVYLPCDAIGGDIYDVVSFPDGGLGIAVADVSGHGVPAAFITAIFKSSFYRMVYNHSKTGDILYHLNNELFNLIKTGHYITGVYMKLDKERTAFQMSGAGHPYPLLYRGKTKTLERPDSNGTPLAWFQDMDYPSLDLDIDSGDKLLIFTDGISEMKNALDEMYGEDKLEELFTELIDSGEPDLLNQLIHKLSDFTQGHPLDDDVSAVLIERV